MSSDMHTRLQDVKAHYICLKKLCNFLNQNLIKTCQVISEKHSLNDLTKAFQVFFPENQVFDKIDHTYK